MSFSQIFEGWKNHLAPSAYLKEQLIIVAQDRMAICRACPLSSMNNSNANPLRFDEHCTACGCSLAPKTKCLSCHCPENKWGSVISSEEEKIIEENEKTV